MIAADANKVYLETMGCQMNKLDSELVQSQLIQLGYRMTDDLDSASVIIYNTCSVREHAEDKVISKISHLKRRHKQDKNLVLAVIGCMAQRRGQGLLNEHDYVDIVCGPGQIHRLGEMIQKNQLERQPTLMANNRAQLDELEQLDLARIHFDKKAPFSAYVRVIRGCSKFCHFCVVPFTRGLEHSRPIDNIYEESRRLVDQGVKEITLLGQTVNSYCYQNGRQYNLADVMERIHDLAGLERIRFVTSYPTDFHDRIMQAIAELPKVCPYLHMPAQSGSDKILKTMNRRYSRSQYIDLVQQYRQSVPGISIVGDIIVGYCGETEEDFEQTADLLEAVRFKNNFIFQYSPRPKTKAWKDIPDDVPPDIKKRRNHQLLELQNRISYQDNQRFVGQTVEILVEGPSKKPHLNPQPHPAPRTLYNIKTAPATIPQSSQLVGRTQTDHITVFDGPKNLVGQIVTVKVQKASALTLFAERIQSPHSGN